MMKENKMKRQGHKKSVVTIILSLMLVASLVVGMSLAFLTDMHVATVAVNTGAVEIDFGAQTTSIANALPGDAISLQPEVALVDNSQDAFVRVRVELTDGIEAITGPQATAIFAALDDTADGWAVTGETVDGVLTFTRTDALTGTNSDSPFTYLTIPTDVTNETITTFNNVDITMTAEAVQSSGFEGDVDAAFSAVSGRILSVAR